MNDATQRAIGFVRDQEYRFGIILRWDSGIRQIAVKSLWGMTMSDWDRKYLRENKGLLADVLCSMGQSV